MEVHRSQGDVSNKIYLVCSNKHQILTFKRLEADDVTWVFWEIHLFAFELDGKIYSTLVFVHKVWSLVGFRILLLLVDRHSNVRCREMDLRPFNYRIVGLIVRPPCCQNTCTFSHIIHFNIWSFHPLLMSQTQNSHYTTLNHSEKGTGKYMAHERCVFNSKILGGCISPR